MVGTGTKFNCRTEYIKSLVMFHLFCNEFEGVCCHKLKHVNE